MFNSIREIVRISLEEVKPVVRNLIPLIDGTFAVVRDRRDETHQVRIVAIGGTDDGEIIYLAVDCYPRWIPDSHVLVLTTQQEDIERLNDDLRRLHILRERRQEMEDWD